MAVFMSSLDGSIVIIALPAIFRGIGLDPLAPANIAYLLWMIMGYRLVQAVFVVNLGRLGDILGRVRIYNLGFVVFTVASILLSVDPFTGSHAALWLIGWRFLQAFGGSMLAANSAAILTDAFPRERRGFALGVNQGAVFAGQFIGLTAGGPARGVGLAGGVLGERPGRHRGDLVGVLPAAGQRGAASGADRLVGQRHLRDRPELDPRRGHLRDPVLRRPHDGLVEPGGDRRAGRRRGIAGRVRGDRAENRGAAVPVAPVQDQDVHGRHPHRVHRPAREGVACSSC
jgi:hypothetical protein